MDSEYSRSLTIQARYSPDRAGLPTEILVDWSVPDDVGFFQIHADEYLPPPAGNSQVERIRNIFQTLRGGDTITIRMTFDPRSRRAIDQVGAMLRGLSRVFGISNDYQRQSAQLLKLSEAVFKASLEMSSD